LALKTPVFAIDILRYMIIEQR